MLNMRKFCLWSEAINSMMEGHRLQITLNSFYHQLMSTYYRDRYITRTQECFLNEWKRKLHRWAQTLCATHYPWLKCHLSGFSLYLDRGGRDEKGSVHLQSSSKDIWNTICTRKEIKLKVICFPRTL